MRICWIFWTLGGLLFVIQHVPWYFENGSYFGHRRLTKVKYRQCLVKTNTLRWSWQKPNKLDNTKCQRVKIMAICCLCHAQGSTNCFPINAFSCVIMPVLAFRANLLLVLDLVWRMVTSKCWPRIQLVTSKGLDLRLLERVLGKWLFFLNWSRGFLMFFIV